MPDKTIVIVDDEEELRENLQDLLEFKDYNVIVYTTGEEILNNIDSAEADLVLLDYQLPGLNGLEVLPKLKEKYPQLPVALVTASSQRDTIEEAESKGADKIILKPYTHTDMLQAVEELLGGN